MEKHNFLFTKNNLCLSIEPVFRTPLATSCTTVHYLVPAASTNLESLPRVECSTNATTATIIRPSPSATTATAPKTQSVSNPSARVSNRRQDPSGMETNRLSTLEIVLIAVCGGLAAVVIGLVARLCTLKKQRSVRFVSFFTYFLSSFVLYCT